MVLQVVTAVLLGIVAFGLAGTIYQQVLLRRAEALKRDQLHQLQQVVRHHAVELGLATWAANLGTMLSQAKWAEAHYGHEDLPDTPHVRTLRDLVREIKADDS